MTLTDVIKEICYRLDDTEFRTYVDDVSTDYNGRAKRAFANAVFMLLDSNNYTKEDVQGLITNTQIVTSDLTEDEESTGFKYDISNLKNIKNIYIKKNGSQFKELQYNEYLNVDISFESHIGNLIKYCILDKYIRFLVGTTTDIIGAFISVLSIENISDLWTKTDSTIIDSYLSITMINKAIGIAVEQLIKERNSII